MSEYAPVVREYRPESDRNLILSSWVRALDPYPEMDAALFFKEAEATVKSLLERTTVKVLCLPDYSNVICGWVCFDEDTLYFAFVKADYRRMTLGTQLVTKVAEPKPFHACKTDKAHFLKLQSQFNPFKFAR